MLTVGQLKTTWKDIPDDAIVVIGETCVEVVSVSSKEVYTSTQQEDDTVVDVPYVWIHV